MGAMSWNHKIFTFISLMEIDEVYLRIVYLTKNNSGLFTILNVLEMCINI